MELNKALSVIQSTLNAPKGQFNSFGKYNYRNCEDILEALKPLLGDCVVIVTDDIVMIGDRYYVKATATIWLGSESISTSAFARECLVKKGMDDAQLTGSCSSYARKYALNGLFLIDDNKDPDSNNNADNTDPTSPTATIKAAIIGQDVNWVKDNWDGVIKNNWGSLEGDETNTLNMMFNS